MGGAKQLHFLLVEDLDGYVFNPHLPEGISFSDPESGLQIDIRSKNERGGYKDGHNNLRLRCSVSRNALPEHIEFVEALIDGRYLHTYGSINKLPYIVDDVELIDSAGKILKGYSPTWDMLPVSLNAFGKEVDDHLRGMATRFVQTLRWQQNAGGPAKILRESVGSPRVYWKVDHENYHLAPLPRQSIIRDFGLRGGIVWGQDARRDFAKLWASETNLEPLGHQLLREAEHIQDENKRSALLIAYSALEVGLEQHLSACVPDASWLAMYSPTPPIFKILRDYLPKLHGEKASFQNWANIKDRLSIVNKFTEDRNRLAHRGEPFEGSIQNYLALTHDLLYAFDVFEGREWAKYRVSSDFRSALGWR